MRFFDGLTLVSGSGSLIHSSWWFVQLKTPTFPLSGRPLVPLPFVSTLFCFRPQAFSLVAFPPSCTTASLLLPSDQSPNQPIILHLNSCARRTSARHQSYHDELVEPRTAPTQRAVQPEPEPHRWTSSNARRVLHEPEHHRVHDPKLVRLPKQSCVPDAAAFSIRSTMGRSSP